MKHKRHVASGGRGFGFALAGGVLSGGLSGCVLLLLLSAIALRTNDPASYLLPMGLAALAVSALILGRVSCAMWGNRSLIPTLASGSLYALLITGLGLAVPGSTLNVWIRCIGCPCILLLALAGGALFRKRSHTRRRTR